MLKKHWANEGILLKFYEITSVEGKFNSAGPKYKQHTTVNSSLVKMTQNYNDYVLFVLRLFSPKHAYGVEHFMLLTLI